MQQFPFFDIVLLAMVAGFIAFRLYTVLGRRTGHERSPEEIKAGIQDAVRAKPVLAKDNVVTMPDRAAPAASINPRQRALLDIKLADRTFDEGRFLEGARAAHERIVTAFARGEREELRGLVSAEIFTAFDTEIRRREAKKERVVFTFAGLKSAQIGDAKLAACTAEITVTFESDIILAGYDPEGQLIEGSTVPHTVTDVWTFARDTKSRDPNWTLVATGSL